MSFEPIITSEKSHELNKEVQRLVDNRLILFCNYEPADKLVTSQGQYFDTSRNNLYLFAKDTCCILGKLNQFDSLLNNCDPQADSLKKQIEESLGTIELFRHVESHNQSNKNGFEAQQRIREYKLRIKQIINKEKIESESDYGSLNKYLDSLRNKLLNDIRDYLSCIGNSPNKQRIAKKWGSLILKWYSENTKREIYWGMLKTTYLSKNPSLQNFSRDLENKTKEWVRDMLLETYNGFDLSDVQNNLNDLRSGNISPADIGSEKLWKLIELRIKELSKLCRKHNNNIRRIRLWEYKDLFFRQLPDQLAVTMETLDAAIGSGGYTLLPQSLLSEDINMHFD